MGNKERAEVVVNTNSAYDIGFQRKPQGYEVVADWWGVETTKGVSEDEFKKLEKEGLLTEDGLKVAEEELQKSTDKFIQEINKILDEKEKEIMEG